jgi:hypothetical protein
MLAAARWPLHAGRYMLAATCWLHCTRRSQLIPTATFIAAIAIAMIAAGTAIVWRCRTF